MAARASTSAIDISASAPTTRSRRVRSSVSRAVRSTAAVPIASDTSTYGTTPPGTARLITTGAGQVLSNPPQTALATGNAAIATTGVWAATAGLDQTTGTKAQAAPVGGWSSLKQGSKVGIIAAAIVIALILVALTTYCCIRKRRAAEKHSFVRRTMSLRGTFISPAEVQKEDREEKYYNQHEDQNYAGYFNSYPPTHNHSANNYQTTADYGHNVNYQSASSDYVVPSPQVQQNASNYRPYSEAQQSVYSHQSPYLGGQPSAKYYS